jgi:hypothetical protein
MRVRIVHSSMLTSEHRKPLAMCATNVVVSKFSVRYATARRVFVGCVFFALSLVKVSWAADMSICFDNSTSAAAKACHMAASATYQAVQVAQAKHGWISSTCQFDKNITEKELVDLLREEYLPIREKLSRDEIPAAVFLVLLGPPAKCPLGTATEVGGLTAGSLLSMCIQASKGTGDLDMCWAYIAALRDSFSVLSGTKGADPFFCSPKTGVTIKNATLLLIRETKRDINKQQTRPAAEVMAEALAREYPCRAESPQDYLTVTRRVLEIIEQHGGKTSALVIPTDGDPALPGALSGLRKIVERTAIPKSKTQTLPKEYLVIESIGFIGHYAKFVGTLGPGALAGAEGADTDCGLRYSITFQSVDGAWQNGPYWSEQCSP